MKSIILICLQLVGIGAFAQFEKAAWISPGYNEDTLKRPCPVFKRTLIQKKNIRTAILYITALGVYEAKINDQRVGDAYFTPGWTSYDRRLQYQEYQVDKLLKKGINQILVTVGEGWYRGPFGGNMMINNYGSDAGLLFRLVLNYADGSTEELVSDNKWLSSTGPVLHADIYGGEVYDARIVSKDWYPVRVKDFSFNLVANESEAVKKSESFQPKRVLTTPDGDQVIDFGQNISGWVRFKVSGKEGDTVKIYHAEVLDKNGNFFSGNLRSAKALDIYVLKGNGEEAFEPHFTYHGFRYIKVEGCKIVKENFTAIALHTSLEHTGTFTCSNPLINRLQNNIEWSLNSNFFDVPTDCPQRSERLGWTGDAQVFCSTAAFNRNVRLFFTKWLRDLRADQGSNGAVPTIIPDLYGHLNTGLKKGVAGWGDAATIVPWTIFWVYNDTSLLREQYSSMKAWVDYIKSQGGGYLWETEGYGDWLAPGEATYVPYIDQCFWAYSTQILINAAKILHKSEDIEKYTILLEKIKSAFLQRYIESDGSTLFNTQTSYVLALQFNLLPDSLRPKAAEKLVELIKKNNNHLSTGFLGTPYLLGVLSRYGYTNVAFDLLNQETYPSWLYPVKMGATTVWERWDGIRPDSTVQATSYNHYAYGAVGKWLYEEAAGIKPAAPGYKKIIIQPHIGGGLSWVNATYRCAYGKIVSSWEIDDGNCQLNVEIPPGTLATIYIPGRDCIEVGPGTYCLDAGKIP